MSKFKGLDYDAQFDGVLIYEVDGIQRHIAKTVDEALSAADQIAYAKLFTATQQMYEALEMVRDYVADAVRADGGIDHCEIGLRLDLEKIDAALKAAGGGDS